MVLYYADGPFFNHDEWAALASSFLLNKLFLICIYMVIQGLSVRIFLIESRLTLTEHESDKSGIECMGVKTEIDTYSDKPL